MYLSKKIAINRIHRLGLMVTILTLMICPSQVNAQGKGTDWHIRFEGTAQELGTLTFTFHLDKTGSRTIELEVTEGMSDIQKAEALCGQLNARAEFYATRDPANKVNVWVKEAWLADKTIVGMGKEDSGTGEGVEYYCDDPPPDIFVNITLDITGTGTTGGWYKLGIGEAGPLAIVYTDGKDGDQIENELISAFNAIYTQNLAKLIGEKVMVGKVPCPLGVALGTNDAGLSYRFDMRQTSPMPALSQYGLMILLLLVAGSGVWLMLRKRRVMRA